MGAPPNIGYHTSQKELRRGENVSVFYHGACDVAGSLQARLAGSHGFWNQAHLFLSKGKAAGVTINSKNGFFFLKAHI